MHLNALQRAHSHHLDLQYRYQNRDKKGPFDGDGSKPCEKDVLSVTEIQPGLVLRENLAALAERCQKRVSCQAGDSIAYAGLCAVPVMDIKIQQRHPLNACPH